MKLLANPKLSINEIAKRFDVAPATIKYAFPNARVEYLKPARKGRRT